MPTRRETENVNQRKPFHGGQKKPTLKNPVGKTDRKSGAGQARLSPPPRLLIK